MKINLFVFLLGRWALVADCPNIDRCVEAQHIHHADAVEWHQRARIVGKVETLCTIQSVPADDAVVADLRGIGSDNCPRLRTLPIRPAGKPAWPPLPDGNGITSGMAFAVSEDGKQLTETRFVTWIGGKQKKK